MGSDCKQPTHAPGTAASFSVPKDKIAVIPNGTDPDVFNFEFDPAEFRKRYAHPSEEIILFVGRLVREKGVQVLLNAAPNILSRIPSARFLIVGSGYYADELKQQAYNLGIADRVNFLGYVSEQDLLRLYRVADAVAIPSLYEPFGIVALEGMAAKVPVVSSDAGGLTDFVENMVTGVTTYAGDANSVAWGLTEVLTNPHLYERLRRDAYEKVCNIYNWKVIAKRTLQVYEKVLKEAEQIGVDGVTARPKQPLSKTAGTTQPFISPKTQPV